MIITQPVTSDDDPPPVALRVFQKCYSHPKTVSKWQGQQWGSRKLQTTRRQCVNVGLILTFPDSCVESPYETQMFLPVWSPPLCVYFRPSWVLDRQKQTRGVRLLVKRIFFLKRPHWCFQKFWPINYKSGSLYRHQNPIYRLDLGLDFRVSCLSAS